MAKAPTTIPGGDGPDPFTFDDLPPPRAGREPHVPRKWLEAQYYVPHAELREAIELAISLKLPLLLSGEPGSGKTTAAYWAAWRLGLEPSRIIHAQVRSDSTAARLKYEFDVIQYFRDSHIAALRQDERPTVWERYIRPGKLWEAFQATLSGPVVLLLDEIDKAPRDFPNDLLQEFEELAFEVPEWPLDGGRKRIEASRSPGRELILVVLTSNGERSLPDAFLRRCLHHHVTFSREWLHQVVDELHRKGQIRLPWELVKVALERYIALRATPGLTRRPGLGECRVWLEALAFKKDLSAEQLGRVPLERLPALSALLKEPADEERLRKASRYG